VSPGECPVRAPRGANARLQPFVKCAQKGKLAGAVGESEKAVRDNEISGEVPGGRRQLELPRPQLDSMGGGELGAQDERRLAAVNDCEPAARD